jgi:hypothetical protein
LLFLFLLCKMSSLLLFSLKNSSSCCKAHVKPSKMPSPPSRAVWAAPDLGFHSAFYLVDVWNTYHSVLPFVSVWFFVIHKILSSFWLRTFQSSTILLLPKVVCGYLNCESKKF